MFDIDDVRGADLPQDLDAMAPGAALAAALERVDVARLSGHDRIVALRAHHRLASHYRAAVYEDMEAVVDALDDGNAQEAAESAAAEIRLALRLTRRAADNELSMALDLRRRLPMVGLALAAGLLDDRRARAIVYATAHLSDDAARDVVASTIDEAPGLTSGQLVAHLRRACIEVDPDDAKLRYDRAVAERRVVADPDPSGTCHLYAMNLPPERVAAVTRRLNQMARALSGPGESRTMDQRRADVFLDLLDGTASADAVDRRGVVDIRVDLTTLARLTDSPGDLAGYGPVIADIARDVAEAQRRSTWRFTVTDPADGSVVATDITRRRPDRGQRRRVEGRNPVCVFPGCRMPTTDCDLDHRVQWSRGGPTVTTNLDPLCRHDHGVRHRDGWSYRRLADGDHEWCTPLGHLYFTSGRPP